MKNFDDVRNVGSTFTAPPPKKKEKKKHSIMSGMSFGKSIPSPKIIYVESCVVHCLYMIYGGDYVNVTLSLPLATIYSLGVYGAFMGKHKNRIMRM